MILFLGFKFGSLAHTLPHEIEIDLFGGTELIALDILDKTEKTPGHRKNTEVI